MCKNAGPKLCPLFTSLRATSCVKMLGQMPHALRALPYTSQGDSIDDG